jgi:hypothetical protein
MSITRREFVAAAAVGGVALAGTRPIAPSASSETEAGCTVLDLGAGCSLRESVLGYGRAVAGVKAKVASMIVPAAVTIPRAAIERHLWRGGLVLFESGGGFLDARAFAEHRKAVSDVLDIHIGAPRHLRPRRTPYVEFHWPTRALVRDFSAVIQPDGQDSEVVATIDGRAVAIVRRARLGHVLFLGSPLGPALWVGDPDARRWLRTVLDGAGTISA